jgi:hypothetical protein
MIPLARISRLCSLSPGLTAYVSYILAGMRWTHPELGLDEVLTSTGRKYVELAKTNASFRSRTSSKA